MTEIVAHCPLCGASSSAPFDQREFRGQLVTNVICRRCGLVYQSPRMTEAESQAFYEAEYRLLYQGQEGPNPKDLAVQTDRAQVAAGIYQTVDQLSYPHPGYWLLDRHLAAAISSPVSG